MICSMPWAEKVIFPSSLIATPSGRTTFVPRVTPSGRAGLPSSEASPAVSSVSAGAVSTASVSVAPLVGAGALSAAKQTAERLPIIRTAQAEIVRQTESYLLKLANASEVQILPAGAGEPENCAAAIVGLGQVYLPLGDLIDVEKELARLQKEQKSLEGEIARCNGKLQNQGFLAKAPEKVVQEEKEKLAKYAEMLERVGARLDSLKKL